MRGPRPKDPSQRARTNADPIPHTHLKLKAVPQPKLPACPKYLGGRWPARTLAWWATWGEAAQAELFTQTDWDFLIDTALVHAKAWKDGDHRALAELRMRVTKFGATADDRARLRYFAEKGEELPGEAEAPVERPRYGEMRVVN